MSTTFLCRFFNLKLHIHLKRFAISSQVDVRSVVDVCENHHLNSDIFATYPAHILAFLRAIKPVFNEECMRRIPDNIQRFCVIVNDDGSMADLFLSERTIRDWIECIVEEAIAAIHIRESK